MYSCLCVLTLALQVQNISTTHTFRIDKARSQLGYSPEKFAFADSVDHYIKTRPEAQNNHIFFKVSLSLIFTLSLIFLSLEFDSLSVLLFFKETQQWLAWTAHTHSTATWIILISSVVTRSNPINRFISHQKNNCPNWLLKQMRICRKNKSYNQPAVLHQWKEWLK